MNRVSTKGEYLHEIIEKIEKEKKLDETLLNEGISEKKDMQWNFESRLIVLIWILLHWFFYPMP